jgi:hypothetical protein
MVHGECTVTIKKGRGGGVMENNFLRGGLSFLRVQGNKRTPDKFVGKEAVVTSQCLNGW